MLVPRKSDCCVLFGGTGKNVTRRRNGLQGRRGSGQRRTGGVCVCVTVFAGRECTMLGLAVKAVLLVKL